MKPECFGDFGVVIHNCFKRDCKLIELCRIESHKAYLKALKEFRDKEE